MIVIWNVRNNINLYVDLSIKFTRIIQLCDTPIAETKVGCRLVLHVYSGSHLVMALWRALRSQKHRPTENYISNLIHIYIC